jgi:lipopolysaccharide export system permease protein
VRLPEIPLLVRYLLRELLVPLLLWVVFLFLLLFVMQFLRGTDVLLGSAVTPWDFLRLVVHLSPHLLVMSVPVGFLLAILLGLGRLGEDRELLALLSLGATPWQIARVPLLVGGVLGALVLVLASTAEPWGLKQVKVQVSEVIKKNVLGDVRPGVFYEDLTDLTLYAQEVDRERGVWTHVLVHDDRDPRAPLLVLAHEGTVNPSGRGASLAVGLKAGEVHRAEHTGTDYAVLTFRDGSLSIGVEDSILRKNHFRSPKEELTPAELLAAANEARAGGKSPAPFLTAFHVRLAEGLTPLAFALFGVPLAMSSRAARTRGYMLALGAYVAYYIVERSFENLGTAGRLAPWLAGVAPNLVFGAFGAWLFVRLTRRGLVA